MTTTARVATLPLCDLCRAEGAAPTTAAYDGKTIFGPWAYMCEQHYAAVGVGLGTGMGQRLVLDEPEPEPEPVHLTDEALDSLAAAGVQPERIEAMRATRDAGFDIHAGDVTVHDEGTVTTFTTTTTAGAEWVDENLPLEGWQWLSASTFAVDSGLAAAIVDGMVSDGLTVEGGES